MDLTLQVEQATKGLQRIQKVLMMKEADFVEAITVKEKKLKETVTKLQDTELKLIYCESNNKTRAKHTLEK